MNAAQATFIDDIDYTRWQRIPYSTAEQTPNGFNCWGLVRAFLRDECGFDIGPIGAEFDDIQRVKTQASEQLMRGCWQAVAYPTPFCVVQMSHATIPHHIGVYVPVNGGAILHTTVSSGSLIQKRSAIAQVGFHINGYYEWRHHEKT